MKFNISIANVVIEINCKYDFTFKLCSNFLSDKPSDFSVTVDKNDIKEEQTGNFSDDYLESLAVYRKIATKIIDYDTFLIHGSSVCVDGLSYLFIGKSGAGKSTHVKLWTELFGKKAQVINDDKPLIKVTNGEVYVCGTPWCGKHNLSLNKVEKLKSICLVEQGSENKIDRLYSAESVISQVFVPDNCALYSKTIDLLSSALNSVDLYKLTCKKNVDAAKLAYKTMSGK